MLVDSEGADLSWVGRVKLSIGAAGLESSGLYTVSRTSGFSGLWDFGWLIQPCNCFPKHFPAEIKRMN